MITGRQIRAARALLDWTAIDLAEKSGLTRETVSRIEADTVQARDETLDKIVDAFDEAGLEFLPGEGLRRKNRMVQVYEGTDANRRLLDDVYKTLRDSGGEVLIAGLDESLVIGDVDQQFLDTHLKRLETIGVKERLLIKDGDTNFVGPFDSYRWLPTDFFSSYPLYIYGSKLALVSWAPSARCVIVDDEAFAESVRKLFNFVWKNSKKPSKSARPKG